MLLDTDCGFGAPEGSDQLSAAQTDRPGGFDLSGGYTDQELCLSKSVGVQWFPSDVHFPSAPRARLQPSTLQLPALSCVLPFRPFAV